MQISESVDVTKNLTSNYEQTKLETGDKPLSSSQKKKKINKKKKTNPQSDLNTTRSAKRAPFI